MAEVAADDSPPTYADATKDGPPAYEKLFPVSELRETKKTSSNKGALALKVCQICCGSFACLCCILTLAALPLAMLVIGSVYLNDCSDNRNIPVWLIVFGTISLVHTLVSVFKFSISIITKKNNKEGNNNRNQNHSNQGGTSCESLLSTFLFIWIIVGSFWVFNYQVYVWNPRGCTSDPSQCNCNPVVFMFAYITLIVMYALTLFICCCGCCCLFCFAVIAGVAGSKKEQNNENDAESEAGTKIESA